MLAKYTYKSRFNTYQIFLPDVDGLINGSPVKIMGIQVGYVNQIDIVGEDVYVKFVITKPKTKLPQGSTATVEFSGLGGSKSLEIYPPQPHSAISDKLIVARPPKRIHDSLGLLNDMFDQITAIAYDVSHFMDEVGMIKNEKNGVIIEKPQKSFNQFLDYSNEWLNKAQKQTNKLETKLDNHDKKQKNKIEETDANGEIPNE